VRTQLESQAVRRFTLNLWGSITQIDHIRNEVDHTTAVVEPSAAVLPLV
jgi:hypothetical protein